MDSWTRRLVEIGEQTLSIARSFLETLPYAWSWDAQRREATEEYPDPVSSRGKDEFPPRTRGMIFNQIEKCTGCGDCVEVCPTQAIRLETEPGPEPGKLWVSTFDIDYGKCVSCSLCVENCEPASILHTKDFEASVYQRGSLVRSFGRGAVSEQRREKWRIARLEQEELDL